MKKFKSSVFLPMSLVAIMSMACMNAFSQSSNVTIIGKVGGNTNGLNKVYIMYPSSRDSAVIKDGQFSMVVPIAAPVTQVAIVTEYELVNANVGMGRYKMLFLTSPGTLNVDIEDIQKGAKSAKLSGIPSVVEYEQYQQAEAEMYRSVRNGLEPVYGVKNSIDPNDPADKEYISESEKLTKTKMGDMLEKFVRSHPDSYVSAYELSNLKSSIGDDKKVKEIYQLLTANNKQSFAGTDVADYLKGASVSIVGKTAPDFTLSGPDGKSFALSSLKGKYVILDFWASWCQPCIASLPTMRELYNKYKSDKFEICSISIDKDRAAWLLEVKKQRLPWIQVLDNQDVAPKEFAVEAIPTVYLIGPDGTVILKQLGMDGASGNSLQKKLEEVFSTIKSGEQPETGTHPPAGVKVQRAQPAKVKDQ